MNRDTYEIDDLGVIHQHEGRLHHDDRPDQLWPIAFNHDSNVISFRLDLCTPATLRAAALLLEHGEVNG